MVDDHQLLTTWLHGLSRHTQRSYRRHAEQFLAWIGKSIDKVILAELQAYAAHLATLRLRASSRHSALSVIKALFAFAHEEGLITSNVAKKLRLSAPRKTLNERILEVDEVVNMIGGERNPRNRAILHLLYVAGVRREELVALRWRDCQDRGGGAGQITVFGKGGKTRSVSVADADAWSEVCDLRGSAGRDAPVFRSRRGGHLDASQILRIVKAAAKRAGLDARVSPHWLRHCHASHALQAGEDLKTIQQTLGHSNIATTSEYLHARPSQSSGRLLPKIPRQPHPPPAPPAMPAGTE